MNSFHGPPPSSTSRRPPLLPVRTGAHNGVCNTPRLSLSPCPYLPICLAINLFAYRTLWTIDEVNLVLHLGLSVNVHFPGAATALLPPDSRPLIFSSSVVLSRLPKEVTTCIALSCPLYRRISLVDQSNTSAAPFSVMTFPFPYRNSLLANSFSLSLFFLRPAERDLS